MTPRIRLVASDLDHTLLAPSGQLTPQTKRLIARLAALEIRFVPVSGRDLPTLAAMFPQAEWLIAHNGAIMAQRGRVVQSHLLPPATVQALVALAEGLRAVPVLCRLDGAELSVGHAAQTRQLRRFFTRVTEVAALTNLDDVAKVTILVAPSRLPAVRKAILADFGSALQVTAGEADALGVTAAGVNKGAALTALGRLLHVPLASVLAFGDAQNDAAMLQAAGIGMRMADGDPALAATTAVVAPPNREGGVDQVLQQLIAGQGRLSWKGV